MHITGYVVRDMIEGVGHLQVHAGIHVLFEGHLIVDRRQAGDGDAA